MAKMKIDTVKELIAETYGLEQQAGRLLIQIDENKKKIQNYFDENGLKELHIPLSDDTNGPNLVCKKSERATIKYDVDKLKERLDDEMFIEVTKRSYEINDIDKMIALMKESGVRARDFKALLDVKVTADNQAIKRLYEVGEITMNTLKGTFKATISKTIKISEETGDND